jgi:flagellar hook capping protein FlgD
VQQLSEGRPSARHVRDRVAPPGQALRPARSRNSAASWYRWFAVVGLIAALGVVFAYRAKTQHPILPMSGTSSVPLIGSSADSFTSLQTVTSEFGHMPIVRVYYPGLPSSNAWNGGAAAANHSAVVVSFKALPNAILSGADDAALRHFFDTAPFGHPIYYSYYIEPEENIASGQFSLSGFKSAWAHIVNLAQAAHNPYLHSTLILMGWDVSPYSHRNWKDYLPGGGIISTLGWDTYPVGSAQPNKSPQLSPPSEFLGPVIAASKSVGLPYGFAEFGLATASGRAGWLTTVGNYIMSSGALFATYFDGNSYNPALRLTDSASIAVWRGFVTQSRIGSPSPTPSPTPTPSPSASPPSGLHVATLALNPATVAASAQANATLSFQLSQNANITVCVLNASGKVVRTIARPGTKAGVVTIRYLTYQRVGHSLAAGQYTVLVVASNSGGSASAAHSLTVS